MDRAQLYNSVKTNLTKFNNKNINFYDKILTCYFTFYSILLQICIGYVCREVKKCQETAFICKLLKPIQTHLKQTG